MKLIAPISDFDLSNIIVDSMHRTALGLLSGTEVFVTRLSDSPIFAQNGIELILTTIPPDLWGSLFRITFSLSEESGAVAATVAVLKESFNILILETLTTAGRNVHELLAFVSPTTKIPGSDSGIKKQLEKSIPKEILKGCVVNKLVALSEADRLRSKNESQRMTAATKINSGRLLNKVEIEKLFSLGLDGMQQAPKRFISYSDTEEKYVCMYFPPDNLPIAELTIDHSEEPGAIDAFAQEIALGKANIITSFSRLKRSGQLAQWIVTLDLSETESFGGLLQSIAKLHRYMPKISQIRVSLTDSIREDATRTSPFHFTNEQNWEGTFVGRKFDLNTIVSSLGLPCLNGETDENSESDLRTLNGNQNITGTPDNFLISGYFKTGKSTLLRGVEKALSKNDDVLTILWNAKGLQSQDVWLKFASDFFVALEKRSQGKDNSVLSKLSKVSQNFFSMAKSFRGVEFFGYGVKLDIGEPNRTQVEKQAVGENVGAQIDEVIAVVRDLVEIGSGAGIGRFVVLLDEAQTLLNPNPDDEEGKDALHFWQIIEQLFPAINWVVASSARWLHGEGQSGFVAKMKEIRLRALHKDDAKVLLSRGFDSRGVYVPDLVRNKILNMAACQPCYLQALGNAIFDRASGSPDSIDVIDETIFEQAVPIACSYLHSHFSEMREDLHAIFEFDAVRSFINNPEKRFSLQWFSDHARSDSRDRTTYLDVIPGIQNHSISTSDSASFSVVPLFHEWSKTIVLHGNPNNG